MGIPNKTQDPQGPRRNSHGVYSAPTRLLRQAALSEAVSPLPASSGTDPLPDHYQQLERPGTSRIRQPGGLSAVPGRRAGPPQRLPAGTAGCGTGAVAAAAGGPAGSGGTRAGKSGPGPHDPGQ